MATIPTRVQQVLDRVAFAATAFLNMQGSLRPFCIMKSRNEEFFIPAPFFGNEEEKDLFSSIIQMAAIVTKADTVVFVSESWALTGRLGEAISREDFEIYQRLMDEGRSLSEHPNAKEVVNAAVDTHVGHGTVSWEMLRPAPGKVRLASPQIIYNRKDVAGFAAAGRFGRLLPSKKIIHDPAAEKTAREMIARMGMEIIPMDEVIGNDRPTAH